VKDRNFRIWLMPSSLSCGGEECSQLKKKKNLKRDKMKNEKKEVAS